MNKENIKKYHMKNPAVEIVCISLLQTTLGFFASLYAGRVLSTKFSEWWQYLNVPSLWCLLFILTLVILYYIFLSTYSVSRIDKPHDCGAEDVKEAFCQTTVVVISSDAPYEEKIKCANLFAETYEHLNQATERR